MKRIGRIILMIVFLALGFAKSWAQDITNYEQQWKKVDELIQKRALPKSALAEVRKIYARAKKEGQDAQVIKALVYTVYLQQENREDNEAAAIKGLEKELAASKEPATSILKSLLAHQYWQYFQRHRWNMYQRTATTNFSKEDIATWTIEDFHKKISTLYLQSISNEAVLKKSPLAKFDALITKGNMRHLRPTLYDLLAHEALTYFKSNERDLKKPAYAFEIIQPEAFAPAAAFVTTSFTTKDSLSLQHKALIVYQNLLRFHLTDAKPDALIDADLDRIAYVYQNAVMEGKDSLYVQALNTIITKYKAHPAAHQAHYLLAAFYEQQATLYKPLNDTTHQYDRLKAKEILEQVVRDSSIKSEGWTNSYNLLKAINHPSFTFEVEKVNVPAQPFRALVKYRNTPALHFRIIQSNNRLNEQLKNRDNDKYWDALVALAPLKSWQQALPATNDLQEHTVEVKLDALPVGEYILLASTNNRFDKKSGQLGTQIFYVSNISYVNKNKQFFVLHRQSGQPLAKASVNVFTQQYNYKTNRYSKVKQASYTTDRNGYFQIIDNVKNRNYNYFLDISHGSDSLNLDEMLYQYYYYDSAEEKEDTEAAPKKIFFFTDRSIYRPGQTVYFKGIVVAQNKKSNTIVTNHTTKIFLEDANKEDVDSVTVTTNEYGSFSGKFQLPQNVLNGEFTIYDEGMDNDIQFSVEEYKRPKFYIDFEKIKQTYKVGDSITITGNAKAYAGNVVDGAQVVYRVVRQPRYLYPWLFKGGWLPPVQPLEIAHGETKTNNNGKFAITFKAIPDRKVNKKWDPLFDYRIYADITDINGETRSGEQVITAGYKALLLNLKTAERMAVDSFKNIFIRTENLNGEYQPSIVSTTITRLIPEQRLVRNRYWQQPDQFVMSKEEFTSFFPFDEYRDESNYRNWQKGATVFTKTDSTKSNGQWAINNQLEPGFYSIEAITKDRDGNEVKDVRYVELFDEKSNQLNAQEYLWTKGFEKVAEPGEKAQLQVGSAAPEVFVIQQLDKPSGNQQSFSFIQLDKERKTIPLTVSETDRGGFGVDLFFVKHNRFYQFSDVVNVPWTDKELEITYTTFRDKTLPGSEEKWTVKIKGAKGDKAAAEMLASMYDASLDQFKPHSWSKPGIWPVYARTFNWNGAQNFTFLASNQRWANDTDYKEFIKTYDQFIFDLYGYRPTMVRLRGAPSAAQERVQDLAMTDSAAPALEGKVSGVQVQANKELQEVVVTAVGISQNKPGITNPEEIQIRKNFNETAFFFPHLTTDKEGNSAFSFTTPEALTRWKLQTFAHTKELAFGLSQKEMITQKQLMVQPNAPRFLRQGDRMEFSAKIVNLSDKELTGQAELQLVDATTNQSVDGWFQNVFPYQYFTVAAGQSEVVKFPIEVPYLFNNALVWRVVARAENFSDGEESSLPVLTNKLLVTETLPLPVRGNITKNFTFDKLLKANSETLQHHALTVEYTANPAWYAVQALPYLMEFPYECAEQVWNRYYANALATMMVHSSPRIKQIFEQWKNVDTSALLSNLQKNEELKSVLLQETPWVLQAKTEEQQKKNIALLFDMVRMSNELKGNLEKLKASQSENGGFVWFKGGPDDRYITQYIITGIGHLKKLKGISKESEADIQTILQKGIPYLDKKIKEDYERLLKAKADLSKQQVGYMQIQYLYMRSFYTDVAIPESVKTAYRFYRKQAQQFWMKGNKYMQGMTALALNRTADLQTPEDILRSLKETAVTSEELGMYWNDVRYGYSPFWWQAPIETQALLVEAFTEIGKDTKTVDDLRTWLIKNKQTANWRTTKATAEAVYALLLQGTDWLSSEPVVQIKLGSTTVTNAGQKTEAGTGYFKQTIEGAFVKPEMGNITISVSESVKGTNHQTTNNPSWGAVYWQYFEDMDKISMAATPLQLAKKLFVEKNTDRGPVLSPVNEGDAVQVGDKIKVRIELRVDRDMEYVHMKDLRASALEPVNVLSGYKWQGGLGYYETTKDASTNFFFSYLRKGTYVFEYPLFVTHAGNFSNGITTIQSMYAPEFSAHSEGVRINVE